MTKKDYQAIARAIHAARTRVEAPPNNVRFNVSDGLLGIGHATEELADALAVEACETGTTKGDATEVSAQWNLSSLVSTSC